MCLKTPVFVRRQWICICRNGTVELSEATLFGVVGCALCVVGCRFWVVGVFLELSFISDLFVYNLIPFSVNFQLPTPNFQLPASNSQLPTSSFQLPAPNFNPLISLSVLGCRLSVENLQKSACTILYKLPASSFPLPTSHFQLPAPNFPLPTSHFQL